MAHKPILITGATGNVGGALLALCQERGVPFRAGMRQRKPEHPSIDVADQVLLDLTRPETFAPALEGVAGIFLVRPPAISKVQDTLNPLLDVAASAGVEHVVFVSVQGADENRMVPHHGVEQHLLQGQLPYTILRPGFFAQNLGDAYRRDIREDDRLYVPSGDGKAAWIDVRDMADVALRVFFQPEHQGKGYTLTGDVALGFADVARLLEASLSRPISYQAASIPGYLWHLWRRRRLPLMQILVQTILHVRFRGGHAAAIDPTLSQLLSRRPRQMSEYIEDHLQLWTAD